MAFRYTDTLTGTSFNLSNNTLRRDLMLLEGNIDNDNIIQNIETSSTDEDLLNFYAKLNLTLVSITDYDLKQKIEEESDIDTLSFIFSLNKTHFKAIVFLLYEGKINTNGIKDIIDADIQTRNRLILEKFNENITIEPISILSRFLNNELPLFFSNINGAREIKETEIKSFSNIQSAALLLPDMFYLLKNSFFSDLFKNVVWNKSNFNKKVEDSIKKINYPEYESGALF